MGSLAKNFILCVPWEMSVGIIFNQEVVPFSDHVRGQGDVTIPIHPRLVVFFLPPPTSSTMTRETPRPVSVTAKGIPGGFRPIHSGGTNEPILGATLSANSTVAAPV